MHATIYLRDGSRPAVLDARTVQEEYCPETTGLVLKLVCRDAAGHVVADFDRETVLAYRRPRYRSHRKIDRDHERHMPVYGGAGVAAE